MYLFIPIEKIEILKQNIQAYKDEYEIADEKIPLTPVIMTINSDLKMQSGQFIPLRLETIGLTLEARLPEKYLEIAQKQEGVFMCETAEEYGKFITEKLK